MTAEEKCSRCGRPRSDSWLPTRADIAAARDAKCFGEDRRSCAEAAIANLREENARLRKTIEALRSRQAGLLRGREELAQVLRERT